MRLTTWNCHHGTVEDRLAELNPLAPDLVTLQECRRPSLPFSEVIWSGAREVQGIAVASLNRSLRLERLDVEVAPTALPIVIHAPVPFLLLALWALPRYEQFALRVIRLCAIGAGGLPVIVMGDLNLAATSETVRIIREEFGLVSAYHEFHHIEPGAERHPTHYWRRHQSSPWHIDYCFVPEGWRSKIRDVRIGGFEEFSSSDHRPLTIDLDL